MSNGYLRGDYSRKPDSVIQERDESRVLIRISGSLHVRLKNTAKATGKSLNEYCAELLAIGVSADEENAPSGSAPLSAVS